MKIKLKAGVSVKSFLDDIGCKFHPENPDLYLSIIDDNSAILTATDRRVGYTRCITAQVYKRMRSMFEIVND